MGARRPAPVSEATAAAAVFAAVALLPFALSFNPYYLSIFVSALVLAAVSTAWNLLAGVCGQVSFGHALFFGVGAYASAILSTKGCLNPYLAMPASAAIGAGTALLVGVPAFRLRGPYFALAMLAFAEMMKLVARNAAGLTEGTRGIFGIPPPPPLSVGGATIDFYASRTASYYLAALLALAAWLAVFLLHRSGAGLGMRAVRGDEDAAAGIGVPVLRTKVVALSVSAFFTALAGAFYAHHMHSLSPDSAFDVSWSVMPIVGSLFGGMATLIGPSVGALLITGLDEFVFKTFFETGHKLFFGLLMAGVIAWAPSGLLGRRVGKPGRGGRP